MDSDISIVEKLRKLEDERMSLEARMREVGPHASSNSIEILLQRATSEIVSKDQQVRGPQHLY